MNPEISRQKYEKFVNRDNVRETIDLLTNIIS